MNILFICDEYPPGLIGGIGSITQTLAKVLQQNGHHVFVVGLYDYEFGQKNYEEDNGVQVWRLRYGFNLPKIKKLYGLQRKLPNWLKRLLFANRDFRKYTTFVTQLIEQNKIDVVEQPDWISYGYFMGLKKPNFPKLSIPLILKFHGSYTYSCYELGKTPNKYYQAIDVLNYNRADYLASVSQHTAFISNTLFEGNRQIKVLHNAVSMDAETSNAPREDNLVFFSGTLKETKGIFSLLKAWNIVMESVPNAKLILFGKGDIEALKKYIFKEYQSSVFFMGHQPREKLLEKLNVATLAIYPSFIEAFSMAPLESMSRGCPTIYTNKSSGPEVIQDGVNGLLVDPNDPNQIASKILILLKDKELQARLGLAGKKVVEEKFEIGKSAQNHLDFYQLVINEFTNEQKGHFIK